MSRASEDPVTPTGINVGLSSPPATPEPQPNNMLNNGSHRSKNGIRVPEFRPDHRGPHPFQAEGVHEKEPGGPDSNAYPRRRPHTDDSQHRRFPRISRTAELMRNSYDFVVIGSGYGGGIAASRMARTGRSVCLLERGKERWPGEYPSSMRDSLGEVHCSGAFAPLETNGVMVDEGNQTGMFHLIVGQGQNAVVCNGTAYLTRPIVRLWM
jgi:hypothetical protein